MAAVAIPNVHNITITGTCNTQLHQDSSTSGWVYAVSGGTDWTATIDQNNPGTPPAPFAAIADDGVLVVTEQAGGCAWTLHGILTNVEATCNPSGELLGLTYTIGQHDTATAEAGGAAAAAFGADGATITWDTT